MSLETSVHQRLLQYDAIRNSEGQDPTDLVNYVSLVLADQVPTKDFLINDLTEFLGYDDARNFVDWLFDFQRWDDDGNPRPAAPVVPKVKSHVAPAPSVKEEAVQEAEPVPAVVQRQSSLKSTVEVAQREPKQIKEEPMETLTKEERKKRRAPIVWEVQAGQAGSKGQPKSKQADEADHRSRSEAKEPASKDKLPDRGRDRERAREVDEAGGSRQGRSGRSRSRSPHGSSRHRSPDRSKDVERRHRSPRDRRNRKSPSPKPSRPAPVAIAAVANLFKHAIRGTGAPAEEGRPSALQAAGETSTRTQATAKAPVAKEPAVVVRAHPSAAGSRARSQPEPEAPRQKLSVFDRLGKAAPSQPARTVVFDRQQAQGSSPAKNTSDAATAPPTTTPTKPLEPAKPTAKPAPSQPNPAPTSTPSRKRPLSQISQPGHAPANGSNTPPASRKLSEAEALKRKMQQMEKQLQELKDLQDLQQKAKRPTLSRPPSSTLPTTATAPGGSNPRPAAAAAVGAAPPAARADTYIAKMEADLRSVRVSNVHFNANVNVLTAHFSGCGKIIRATLPIDSYTGSHRGYGYVEFAEVASVSKAVALTNSILLGRPISVSEKTQPLLTQGGAGPRPVGVLGAPGASISMPVAGGLGGLPGAMVGGQTGLVQPGGVGTGGSLGSGVPTATSGGPLTLGVGMGGTMGLGTGTKMGGGSAGTGGSGARPAGRQANVGYSKFGVPGTGSLTALATLPQKMVWVRQPPPAKGVSNGGQQQAA